MLRPQKQEDDNVNFWSDTTYTKKKIMDFAESFRDKFSYYYNVRVNRKQEHLPRLNNLRESWQRLYDEIFPKLKKSKFDEAKVILNTISKYEKSLQPISFDDLIICKNCVVEWLEKSGLSNIDLVEEDTVEQWERESY